MATFDEVWPVLVQRAAEIDYVETFSRNNKNDVRYTSKNDSIGLHSRATEADNWKDIKRKHWETAWNELQRTGSLSPNEFLDITNMWRGAAAVPFLQKALQLPVDIDEGRVYLPDDFSVDASLTSSGYGTNQSPDFEEGAADLPPPKRVTTEVSRVIRNTVIGKELKQLYEYRCQVCGQQQQQRGGEPYAEAHHIHPLGATPPGPDAEENLLVLCPNHHADFDYGVIEVDPASHTIRHSYDSAVDGTTLTVTAEHPLADEYLEHHLDQISQL